MSITPGTPIRLVGPKASVNPNNPEDCPILPEGTVGIYAGPMEGSHEWHRVVVSYESAVRLDSEDIEPFLATDDDDDLEEE